MAIVTPSRPPQRDDPEALIEAARARTRRRRRPYGRALALGLLAGTGLYGIVAWNTGGAAGQRCAPRSTAPSPRWDSDRLPHR